MTSEFQSSFFYAFSTFLPVINPFLGAMFFMSLTGNLPDADKRYVATRISIYSFFILTLCLFAGHLILGFFGISVDILRMTGGIVLFASGWTALNSPSSTDAGEKRESFPRLRLKQMAFYPFTLPLTTGPGGIAVSVALGTSLPYSVPSIAGTIAANIAVCLVIWMCYRYSDRVSKAFGAAGSDAIARVFSFILMCLGLSIFWTGFSALWVDLNSGIAAG